MKITASAVRSIAVLLITFGFAAGSAAAADLSKPVTLVATPRLAGSPYAETVLVVAPLPDGMHLGLIVNRPTKLDLATLFPDDAASRNVVDPVYFGGPLLPQMVYAAVRTAPADAENVLEFMPGVALVLDRPAIDRIVETAPNDARYFIGLVAWQPGELDEEIRAGAWDVTPADPSAVFSTQPEMLWKSLSHGGPRLEVRSVGHEPRV